MEQRTSFVSAVIPCRNEARFIRACLESVLACDYPGDRLEVLVVDGQSDDGTVELVQQVMARDARVRLLPNPRRITPVAMNLAVREARGDVIAIMGAHATYPPDYLSRCVRALHETGADNVGGVIETLPGDRSPFGEAIAAALSHPFGVGDSRFRTGGGAPGEVDTVFGGCYRRDVFDRIGCFNESLTSSQDIEFNVRLRRAGGRILLFPDIVCHYYARSAFWPFVRNNFRNGVWVMLPFAHTTHAGISWRHTVPMVWVLGLISAAAVSLVWPTTIWILLGLSSAYAVAALAASAQAAMRRGQWRLLLSMPVVFGALHVTYGCGSLFGLARAVAARVLRS
jgi:glycosyltransferase involved in cell wall biosynthesis